MSQLVERIRRTFAAPTGSATAQARMLVCVAGGTVGWILAHL